MAVIITFQKSKLLPQSYYDTVTPITINGKTNSPKPKIINLQSRKTERSSKSLQLLASVAEKLQFMYAALFIT